MIKAFADNRLSICKTIFKVKKKKLRKYRVFIENKMFKQSFQNILTIKLPFPRTDILNDSIQNYDKGRIKSNTICETADCIPISMSK